MPNERTIPSEQPKTVATATIVSNGRDVPATFQVLSVVVQKELNRIAAATLVIADGDPAGQTFSVSNTDYFEPGCELEIKLGYRGTEEIAYKGIVVKHAIRSRSTQSMLIIECRDKAFKMTISRRSNYFSDIKDSEIMEQLAGSYQLDTAIEPESLRHGQMVQYNSTDWDFIMTRAEANGMLVYTDNGVLTIKKPDFSAAPVLTFQYGATIHELDAAIDGRHQYSGVSSTVWNYANQEVETDVEAAESTAPDTGNLSSAAIASALGNEDYNLVYGSSMPQEAQQAWADAKLSRQRLAKIRGNLTVDGTVAIEPGNLFELKGAGERFEGKLFATAVKQQFEGGNWKTAVQFGLNPEWFAETFTISAPAAAGLLPPIGGLHIGQVTGLEGDPLGEERILVRIPVLHASHEGAWCRLCLLDAGNNRGMLFRPEPGDEVVVGFVHNDPREGIVLGMLHSSANPAPLPATDDNHEKGYVSRSEMKWLFNDDTKTIMIETPGGHKVCIDEAESKIELTDMHGNKILMNEEGITIESIKDVIIKAAMNATVESGSNTEIKAGANLTAEGGSGAELSSGAVTNVKGSIINLN